MDGAPAMETSLEATVTRVLIDDRLSAYPCGGRTLTLDPGEHRIDVRSTEEFAVESVTLEPATARVPWLPPQAPQVLSWDATARQVSIKASQRTRLLETSENANPGWVATLDGHDLAPVRVDGWRQAWIIPAGVSGTAELTFAPAMPFQAGLLVGLAGVIALIALAGVPGGRESQVSTMAVTSQRGQWLLALSALLAAALVGGVVGLIVGGGGVLAGTLLRRAGVALVLATGAAIAATGVRWPDPSSAPGILATSAAVLAIAAVSSAAAPDRAAQVDEAGEPTLAEDVR